MTLPLTHQTDSLAAEVPFQLGGGRKSLIVVPVHVNGDGPYPFLLDTGASHCLISEELAEKHRVRREREEDAMGAGGAVRLAFGRLASLAVGSAHESDAAVGITSELERLGAAIQYPVAGNLGVDFLKGFVVTIDYPSAMLSLGRKRSSTAGFWIPFELASPTQPLIVVPVEVNGEGPFPFVVDTGASRTTLSTGLVRQLGIETTESTAVAVGDGRGKFLSGEVRSIAVARAIAYHHRVGAGDFMDMLSAAIGRRLDGIVGFNFLNQFRVTIDYPERVLGLLPLGDASSR